MLRVLTVACMPPLRHARSAVALTIVALLVGALTAVERPSTVSENQQRLVSSSSPTNAGKVYRWGLAAWKDEFRPRLSRAWAVNHRKLVRNQNGMLTLDGTARSGTVTATVKGRAHRYGRWEARVRGQQWGRGHRPYHVIWELVPAGDYRCGGRSIVISDFTVGSGRANSYIRTAPRRQFVASKARNLGNYAWHTYAVEVTKKRISWFVDTRVVMTERRDAALSGTRFKMRFRLAGAKGARMNPSRMQMDWVRYYTLERPNARSVAAPQARRGSYAGAC